MSAPEKEFAPRGQKRLDPLDLDLLARLEAEDRRLSLLLHEGMKYRHILRLAVTRLRSGADPGPVRASLAPWRRCVAVLKRVVRDL